MKITQHLFLPKLRATQAIDELKAAAVKMEELTERVKRQVESLNEKKGEKK